MKQLKTSKDLLDNVGKKVKVCYLWVEIEWLLEKPNDDFVEVAGMTIHLQSFDNGTSNAKEVFLIDNVIEKEVATPKRLKQHDDYKVWDKVRIRQWDDMEKEFWLGADGNINCNKWFTTNMQEFCWKTLTISSVIPDSFYVRETHWNFSTDMFEKEYIDQWTQQEPIAVTPPITKSELVAFTPSFDDIMKANAMINWTTVSYDLWKPALWDITVTTSSSTVPSKCVAPKSTQFKILTFKKY